jgi:hypothetical protein
MASATARSINSYESVKITSPLTVSTAQSPVYHLRVDACWQGVGVSAAPTASTAILAVALAFLVLVRDIAVAVCAAKIGLA